MGPWICMEYASMTDWEYKEEFHNDEWILTVRNLLTLSNLKCLIRWFLNMKGEQGWETVSFSPHVLDGGTSVYRGIVEVHKRPLTPELKKIFSGVGGFVAALPLFRVKTLQHSQPKPWIGMD